MSNEQLVMVGLAVVVLGIILIIAGSLISGNAKVAVGGFIGPIPFGFGNDEQMVKFVIAIAAIAFVLFLLLPR